MTAQHSDPWYRYPIVWLIVAIPASSIMVGILLMTMATRTPESVVRDDYYQAGRSINIDLRETRRAEELDVQATFTRVADQLWQLDVKVPAVRLDAPQPIEPLEVMLAHPTRASKDLDFTLRPAADGFWTGRIEAEPGMRNLAIQARGAEWQLRGQVQLIDDRDAPITISARRLGADS